MPIGTEAPRNSGHGEARLRQQIRRTRLAMMAEAMTRAYWPVTTLGMAGIAFWAFGGLASLGPDLSLVAVGVFGLGLVLLIALGTRRLEWPSEADAVARLDAALPGRPISSLSDTIAVGRDDPGAQALWQRHLERMAERAAAARASRPDLRLSGRDPYALRLVALVAVVAAALFARGPAPVELALPGGGTASAPVAAGPSFEAWANPPAYTGRPTLYLAADTPPRLDLPQGTEVTVRVYGAEGGHALTETVSGAAAGLQAIAEGISSATFPIASSGRIALLENGSEIAGWDVTLIPDQPPRIAPEGDMARAASGAMELGFTASDDYGVASAQARITLDLDEVDRRHGLVVAPEEREEIVLDLPMPFSGGSEEVAETLVEDLSRHPWVGLPVRVELLALDDAGQEGVAAPAPGTLPGRRFFDPLARAILEQRRDLLWSVENADRVDMMLRVITHAPDDVFTNPTAYMMARMALRRLGYATEDGLDAAERDDIAELLWQTALVVEDGSLSDARERLRRAQDRLSDALRNGATEEEIAELMQELREAMQDYMQQLAQEAMRNQDQMAQQPQPDPSMTLSQDQLQQMLDEIQRLAESGQQEQAQALLEQLQQLLENLQMQMAQGGQNGQQQGQQMMQELQDTLRQQQDLADDSFQELQRQFNQNRQPGQQGQQQGQPGQPGQQQGLGQGQGQTPGMSAEQLAQRQEALRQMLDQLRGQLPSPGTEGGAEARDQLDDAERQMGGARDSLEQGDLDGALDRQADAMEALREGIRGLGEEMQQQAQQNQGDAGDQPGEGMARDDRDPLGRPSGARGNIRSDENLLPGQDMMRRAQELFDEIRRRSGEQSRPDEELDYLRRLLDRF
ncbi:TIGR02302 family protein [Halovulum dunhuangense]|uniref:TIGR02302 family protein n=1 Tax=Halovulum dunhuangense TaxID=1505036 RepID=A0A849KZ16_9RHOB|nr:TIGR02302 family protein [Halovulum dunhuangense]NNU79646.1 TIGR02302 family protein [Halovulum dunhuangense]